MKIARSDLTQSGAKTATTEQPQTMEQFAQAERAAQRDRVLRDKERNNAARRSFDPQTFDRHQRHYGRD